MSSSVQARVLSLVSHLGVNKETFWQVVRYGLTGLSQTGIGYLGYLFLTHYGVEPKTAMSIFFVLGVVFSYSMNRKWTFAHRGNILNSGLRYGTVYLVGYFLNLMGLYLFVDLYGWPHQWVQLALIVILGVYFFVTLKLLVFKAEG